MPVCHNASQSLYLHKRHILDQDFEPSSPKSSCFRSHVVVAKAAVDSVANNMISAILDVLVKPSKDEDTITIGALFNKVAQFLPPFPDIPFSMRDNPP